MQACLPVKSERNNIHNSSEGDFEGPPNYFQKVYMTLNLTISRVYIEQDKSYIADNAHVLPNKTRP